jgi:hypothetical protein
MAESWLLPCFDHFSFLMNGQLRQTGMGKRAITKRVKVLGEALGIKELSAHDCSHFSATGAARHGTMIDQL